MYLKKPLALAIISLSASMAHSAIITIENSGFEDGFNDWNETDPASVSGESYNGSSSAKISGSGGRLDQQVSLNANTDYVLTAYVKGSGEIGANLGSSTESTKSESDDWTHVTVEFNSGSATSAELFAEYYDDEGRFDDFSLESVGSTTPTPTPSNTAINVPGIVEAEDYDNYSDATSVNSGGEYRSDGVDIQTTTDSGGGYNVGWTDSGEYLEYTINVDSSANYTAGVRVASQSGGGLFALEIDGSQVGSQIAVDSTGDWQRWETQTIDLGRLTAGEHTLRVDISGGNFNLNWIEIQASNGTPTPTPTGDLDSNATPSENFDLSEWNLGVPVDNDDNDKSDTISVEDLNDGYESEFFYTGSDGGLVFKNYVDGPKTSTNTSYTRSELREILGGDEDAGDTEIGPVNWVFSSTSSSVQNASGGVDGTMRATLAVNHVTSTGNGTHPGRTIIGQIHAKDNEPCRLYYRKLPGNTNGSIYFAHETKDGDEDNINIIGSESTSQSNPSDGIALGEVFTYEIKAEGDDLTVTIIRDGKDDVTGYVDMSDSGYDESDQYMYFKAGLYTQNNTGEDDDYDQATFYSIETSHD